MLFWIIFWVVRQFYYKEFDDYFSIDDTFGDRYTDKIESYKQDIQER